MPSTDVLVYPCLCTGVTNIAPFSSCFALSVSATPLKPRTCLLSSLPTLTCCVCLAPCFMSCRAIYVVMVRYAGGVTPFTAAHRLNAAISSLVATLASMMRVYVTHYSSYANS